MQKKGILQGAVILTTANLITRVLGFVYRIFMSKTIGAEGMGLYQLIMPVYMLIWSLSSSGFSTTISRLTAQENAKNKNGNIRLILKLSIITSVAIAIILSVLTFIFSDYIAQFILKDIRCSISLKILSLCFSFMAAGSCIRGYFYGLQDTIIPASSQVIEQIVRMAFVYFLAEAFIPKGIVYACAAAVIGMAMGEIISFIYVFISYRHSINKGSAINSCSLTNASAYALILSTAVPLTLNRVTGSLLSTIENILIPQRLLIHGMSSAEAISLYGQLSAMAIPLLMFPSSLLTAIATALVPAVSEAQSVKNNKRIQSAVSKALFLTSIMGIGTCGAFFTFPYELSTVIYSDYSLGSLLKLLSLICPFLYLQVTLSGILNGLGEQLYIFRANLFSSAINIAFIYFLIPIYGIKAFIIGWFITCTTISIISVIKIKKKTKLSLDSMTLVIKPALCIITACILSKILSRHCISSYTALGLSLCLCCIGAIYFILLLLSDCIKPDALKTLTKKLRG